MIGLVVKLALFIMVVYFIYNAYRKLVIRLKNSVFGGSVPMSAAEECPSCRMRIRVAKEPGACPKCAAPLGRNPDGKLLIRITE